MYPKDLPKAGAHGFASWTTAFVNPERKYGLGSYMPGLHGQLVIRKFKPIKWGLACTRLMWCVASSKPVRSRGAKEKLLGTKIFQVYEL